MCARREQRAYPYDVILSSFRRSHVAHVAPVGIPIGKSGGGRGGLLDEENKMVYHGEEKETKHSKKIHQIR